jgi:hypothetical protein
MAGDLAAVRGKIQQYLTHNFDDVNIDSDGDLSIRDGSARVFVQAWTHDDADWTAINVFVPLLFEVKETPAIFEYIALHADDYVFGHLNATRTDDGLNIFLSHCLLGDYLDEEELVRTVGVMISIVDDLDDELKAQFGGRRYNEE